MDAPAMVMRKHVPEDVGLRNIAADEEGVQQQLHREEKQHKAPVLKKVKEKVKKIKNTIAGHGHDGAGAGDDHRDERGSSSSGEDEGEEVERAEAAQWEGGYQEDVEDKHVAMDADPEVHGAPMYDSARIPAAQEVEGGDAPMVQLGDLGGPVIEDPAAPRSTTPAPRGGEDIGTTPVVQAFESMTVSDDPPHVGAGRRDGTGGEPKEAMPVSDAVMEEWKDAAAETETETATEGAAPEPGAAATYTEKIKSAAAGTTEYGKKLATTVYEKVAGVGTAVAGKVQQATQSAGAAAPGVGPAAQDASGATATPGAGGAGNGQDKGVTVTGYIADKLRPGEEDRALSETISGAVQRRKEEVGSTVAQRVPAPGEAIAKAREAVTSLAGGNRASETVQPTTEGSLQLQAGGDAAVEGPVLRGEEIGGAKTNVNTM